jgi:hypothetical protein
MLWSPAAGDLDSDGTIEIVANTREGYTMVWHTPGLASGEQRVVALSPRRMEHRAATAPTRVRPDCCAIGAR